MTFPMCHKHCTWEADSSTAHVCMCQPLCIHVWVCEELGACSFCYVLQRGLRNIFELAISKRNEVIIFSPIMYHLFLLHMLHLVSPCAPVCEWRVTVQSFFSVLRHTDQYFTSTGPKLHFRYNLWISYKVFSWTHGVMLGLPEINNKLSQSAQKIKSWRLWI